MIHSLMHPQSPVERLFADHNTGSGNTLVTLRVLDNLYDPRPKLCVFPKDAVVDNFYVKMEGPRLLL